MCVVLYLRVPLGDTVGSSAQDVALLGPACSVMPRSVLLTVALISGRSLTFSARSRATVAWLKTQIEQEAGVRASRQRILHAETQLADDVDFRACAVFPRWCVIEGILSPDTRVPWETELALVVQLHVCQNCGYTGQRMQHCQGCFAHYCCADCQLHHWPAHRKVCISSHRKVR